MSELIWTVPEDLLAASITIMRPHGARGNEGLALWLGTSDDPLQATVSHVVELYGSGFLTSPLHMRLSLRAMAALTDLADRLGVYLVGQIHSHPGTFIDLSELDKAQGMRIPDYLSVVCPHYAQRSETTFGDCGVHVFESTGYRWLPPADAARRILYSETKVTVLRYEVAHD